MNDNAKLGIGLIASIVLPVVILYAFAGSSEYFMMHAIMLAVFVPLVVLGIYMAMTGKGSFMIAGYNTAPSSIKAAYDEVSMTKAFGIMLIGISVLMFLAIESFVLGWGMGISIALTVISVVFMIVGIVNVNRKKYLKDPSSPLPVPTEAEKKRNKYIMIAAVGVTAVVLVIVAVLMFSYGDVSADLEDDRVVIKAPMVDETVKFDDIVTVDDIQLRYDIDTGSRVSGFGTSKISSGNFRNAEFGNYTLASYTQVNAYIVIYSSGHVVFNLGTVAETQDFYDRLVAEYNMFTA